MKKLTTLLKKKNRGFTLVELIVVIAILAILAAIALPQLLGFQDRAREQADKQTAIQVRNATALLYANSEIEGSGTITVPADTDGVTAEDFVVDGITLVDTDSDQTVAELIIELTDTFDVVGKKNIEIILGADGDVTQSLVVPE
jgi:type IV pilus assembly protein PilA